MNNSVRTPSTKTYRKKTNGINLIYYGLDASIKEQVRVIRKTKKNIKILRSLGYGNLINLPSQIPKSDTELQNKISDFYLGSDFVKRRMNYWDKRVFTPLLQRLSGNNSSVAQNFLKRFKLNIPRTFGIFVLYYGCGSFVSEPKEKSLYPYVAMKMEFEFSLEKLMEKKYLQRSRRVALHELIHLFLVSYCRNSLLSENDDERKVAAQSNRKKIKKSRLAKELLVDLIMKDVIDDMIMNFHDINEFMSPDEITNPMKFSSDPIKRKVIKNYKFCKKDIPSVVRQINEYLLKLPN